jgi:hypothetical protein
MRHFIIYCSLNIRDFNGNGHISVMATGETYPNKKKLKESAEAFYAKQAGAKVEDVLVEITGIQEVSKEDFDSFFAE